MADKTAGKDVSDIDTEWNLEEFLTLTGNQDDSNFVSLSAKYGPLLDDPDLTDDQREEALQILWNFVTTLLDFNFGIHSIQLAKSACGEVSKNGDEKEFQAHSVVKFKNSKLAKKFTQCAKKTKRRHKHDI